MRGKKLSEMTDKELLALFDDPDVSAAERKELDLEAFRRMGVDPVVAMRPSIMREDGSIDEAVLAERMAEEAQDRVGLFYAAEVTADEDDESHISTMFIRFDHDFETMLFDLREYGGVSVKVEKYDTRAEAEAGHARWMHLMATHSLPDPLVDIEDGQKFDRQKR